MLEIRAADLRFTDEEAAAYYNTAMGLALTADDVRALEDRTEGWAAALQLAALSMQGRDDVGAFIAGFTGNDRFIVDYLVDEVLQRQPDDRRRFLLQTSVLGRLNGPLCAAVTGDAHTKDVLEALERANLFLVALDDRRVWYRYHHLFADVLRARLLDERPDLVQALHRRASAWFDANGERAEAIVHTLAGEDHERAAQLVEVAAPAMQKARQEATLRRWLEALPDDLYSARPVLTMALVGARMATGDTTGCDALLTSIEQCLDTAGASPAPIVFDTDQFARLPAQVAIQRSGLALLAGDLAGTVTHAEHALAGADPSDHLRRGSAHTLLGLAYWTAGELDAARVPYTDAVRDFVLAGYFSDVLGCSLALGDIQVAQGCLDDAQRTFATGLRYASEHPGLRGAPDMHVGMSEVLYKRDELDEAERQLDASDALGEPAGLPQHEYRRRLGRARLRQARGDLDGALALLDEADRFYNTDYSPSVRPIAARRARVQILQGDVAAAQRWAADRGLTADDDLRYVLEFEHITLARALLAEGSRRSVAAATGLLRRLLGAAEAGGRVESAIEVLVLLALAHHARGDAPAAHAALDDALVARVARAVRPHLPRLRRRDSAAGDPARRGAPRFAPTSTPGASSPRSASCRSRPPGPPVSSTT